MTPAILRQAAEWLVRLDHQPDAASQQAFHAWLAADPQHPLAVARLQGHLSPLKQAPARAALRRARQQPKAIKGLALGLLIGLLALPVYQYSQRGYLFADLSTASGQWQQQRLDDGSALQLDGGSAVDLHFDANQRRVRLLQGELLVDVAKDARRPFYVDTPQGSIRALGTRFIVERSGDATVVRMLESSTRIDSGTQQLTLNPGQRVRLEASGPGRVEAFDARAHEAAWDTHQLLASDEPLADVLERLGRHRSGLLLFDRQALHGLRVTVMLPFDDPARALRLLQRTLPIEISSYTPWVTRVSLKKQRE
ncbi:anti-FecI sigma factor FecR [Pseudomonas sp. FH4]|uniref:FecR family protein n=1 Tax=Pseudomonas fluorescens group TaxID=136843 RepID=UPI0003DCE592|nr:MULTISPECIES: FecR domain-containing protein [Pseudomonas fluorescens group]ETK17985.1 anti-FecI sigma factor FecR [Pseudomonas sp. FH4]MBF8003298.1 FecR domain-containing protein [Pseudomonas brenneri]WJM93987.1 FecR domain-containing protein [Pseudomonas brenneri]